MKIPHPNLPLQVPSGLACLDSENTALADNLEFNRYESCLSLEMDTDEQVKREHGIIYNE